jgi:hypothetical protein
MPNAILCITVLVLEPPLTDAMTRLASALEFAAAFWSDDSRKN